MITEQIAPEALADIQLSHEEVQRYSRHLIMPEVGMTGQKIKSRQRAAHRRGRAGFAAGDVPGCGRHRPHWPGRL